MKTKLNLAILGIILTITLVSAAFFPEPWGADVDADNYNLDNVNNVTANNFIGSFIGDVDSMNWTKLKNYPVACPGSGAITTLDDSVTCSDLWFDVTGNETITGNMTFSESGILNLSFIESLDWINVSITESQVSDLQSYLLNDTDVNLLDINASTLNITGNLTLGDRIIFRLGEVIDNLVDGWIIVTGNFNVTGNIETPENVTASFFKGDGSELTGIAGGIWTNVSGTATYEDNVNITGNLSIGGINFSSSPLHIKVDSDDGAIRIEENSGIEFFDISVDSFGDLQFVNDAGLISVEVRDSSGYLGVSSRIEHIDDVDTYFAFSSDRLQIVIGNDEFFNMIEQGGQDSVTFNDDKNDIDFRMESDFETHAFFMEASTGFIGINTSTPSFPLEVWGNGSSTVSIWAEGNISATGYITRTSVYDSKRGNVWDWVREPSYYLTNDIINHSKFYGAVSYFRKDTSRPVEVNVTEEDCNLVFNNITKIDEEICVNVTGTITEYPFQVEEFGVDLGEEINVLRQAIYNLRQDNIAMKTELCNFNPTYNWC